MYVTRSLLAAATVLLLLSLPDGALAQGQSDCPASRIKGPPPKPGTMPNWGRPLPPGEARTLYAEVRRLSHCLNLSQRVLIAIAQAVGSRRTQTDFSTLVDYVRAQAQRAAILQSELASLQKQLAQVPETDARVPAETALKAAVQAFEQGRLDDADARLSELATLRLSASAQSRAAWEQAIEARAALAELRLRFDLAEGLRLAAVEEERDNSELRQWRLAFAAADGRRREGDLLGSNQALDRAIDLYRARVLPLAPRERRPREWAQTQNGLAVALADKAERTTDVRPLREAIEAYRSALPELRVGADQDLANLIRMNLAVALTDMAERESGIALIEEAVKLLELALSGVSREASPVLWGALHTNLGNAFKAIGEKTGNRRSYDAAEEEFKQALSVFDKDSALLGWAGAQTNLANTLSRKGQQTNDLKLLYKATLIYREVASALPRDRVPLRWALAHVNLGSALSLIGELEVGTTMRLREAVEAFDAALSEYHKSRTPTHWANATLTRAFCLILIAERTKDPGILESLRQPVVEASSTYAATGDVRGSRWAAQVVSRLDKLQAAPK